MDINNLWSNYDLNSKKKNSRCLSVNTILEGKYLVGPVLGQGGFGITYVGYDLNMESKIAIKEYFPVELVSRDTTTMHGDRVLSLSGEKSVTYKAGLKKYVAEAQNVSQFSEVPGVVSVKDFFYANETAYIVMEFIDGISLKDYLKEKGGRLSEEETLAIMKPILEALVQVHKSGIIHRDISPDNIMLTFEDSKNHNKIKSVKLIDFGAARMTEKNDQKSLTIILKHGYAPEEQYRTHGEQGPWTDVYALCAVLYRMLTGETPVPAMDRMFKDELKTLEQCGEKVSANTAAAILKGLAVKKDDRIQSVQELIGALYEGAKVKPVKTSKAAHSSAGSGAKNKKMPLIAGIGVAAVAACAIGFVAFSGKDGGVPVESVASQMTEAASSEIASQEKTEQLTQNKTVEEKPVDSTEVQTEVFLDTTVQEEVLGEQIVFYHPQRSVSKSNSFSHVLFCMPDGTVEARGTNKNGECDVEYWDHVVAVDAGTKCSVGLRSDGTVLYTGIDKANFSEIEKWTNIIDIQADYDVIVGLKLDGTVVCVGDSDAATLISETISQWENIKALEANSGTVYGLTKDGTILMAGEEEDVEISGWTDVQYIMDGFLVRTEEGMRKQIYGIDTEGRIRSNISSKEEEFAAQEFGSFYGRTGVREDGTLYSEYRAGEELGQWKDVQAYVEMDYNHYYGLTKDGTILSYIDNAGNTPFENMKNLEWIDSVRPYGLSLDTLVARKKDGTLLTYGPDYIPVEYKEYRSPLKWSGMPSYLLQDGTAIIENPSGEIQIIEDVAEIATIGTSDLIYVLLMNDGSVKCYNEHMNEEEIWKSEYFSLFGKKDWQDLLQVKRLNNWAVFGLRKDGTVVYAGREGFYKEINPKEKYRQIETSSTQTLFGLTEAGSLKVLITNAQDKERGMDMAETWTDIQSISVGESHVAGLRKDGTVVALGSNHCGQSDVESWENIVYLTTGQNCTLGINEAGDLLMAGSLY